MTSINAIRCNEYFGATACDEQRGWNDENLVILCTDKIKPVVPLEIQKEYGLVAAYGNTGTSSIGDELRFRIRQKIQERYDEEIAKTGKKPKEFMTIAQVAELTFKIVTDLKHVHIDEHLKGKYGFTAKDYCQGSYKSEGKKIDIKDKDIMDYTHEAITWAKRGEPSTSVFLNGGIVAGYDSKQGFRIFHHSMLYGFYEPVSSLFVADGSGCDLANVKFSDYTTTKSLPERRGDIDPADGLIALIEAVNSARRYNLGVGGYVNLILFNGKENDNNKKMSEVNDDRCKLASEIVYAYMANILTRQQTTSLIQGLVLENRVFEEVNEDLWRKARDPRRLSRLLRGYKMDLSEW